MISQVPQVGKLLFVRQFEIGTLPPPQAGTGAVQSVHEPRETIPPLRLSISRLFKFAMVFLLRVNFLPFIFITSVFGFAEVF